VVLAALLVAGGVGLLIGGTVSLHHAEESTNRGENALVQLFRTESLAEDLATGLRGYELTHETAFLAPWRAARVALPGAERAMLASLAGDPARVAEGRELIRRIHAYALHSDAMLAMGTRPQTAAMATLGKRLYGAIGDEVTVISAAESAQARRLTRSAHRSAAHAVTEGVVVLVALVLLVAAFVGVLGRIIVARERARRRAAFLAEASSVLDTPVEPEDTLRVFTELVVPDIADWCTVELLEAGQLRTIAIAHVDPAQVAAVRRLRERFRLRRGSHGDQVGVVNSGEPALYRALPEELLRDRSLDEEHLQTMLELGMARSSVMVVPMIARGRSLGAITFVSHPGGRRYDGEDLQQAAELGRRVALAVDTASLLRRNAQTARVLQASLLPEELPAIPGIELSARFRPAAEGALVGGDFYDVYATGPGRWAVVIGDVCGKGAPAAALTAMARYTLRAISASGPTPAQALGELGAAMLRQDLGQRFITVVYASLDLGGTRPRLSIACGGHPPPIYVPADGAPRALAVSGRLLGVWEELELHGIELELDRGDALVLYSDGVTDQGAGHSLTPGELAARLSPAASAAQLADAVEAIALSRPGLHRDDVALLCLRSAPRVLAGGAPAVASAAGGS
jgi:serine phosphatase RsbU (regulator of sigma subunit)/CHASE3 domain sensor protein